MRHTAFVLAIAAVLTAVGCRADIVPVTGTVHYFTFEGGFWAVRGDDSTTYDPLNGLPSQFQHDGERVRFEAKVRPDLMNVHAAGPIVEIISIQPL
jgi:hypothetical protein